MAIAVQDFRERMEDKQSVYKTVVLGIKQMGWSGGNPYPHILPEDSWSLNLWHEISCAAVRYFTQWEIAWHHQKHNMLSSQVMSVNIFFPLREHLDLLRPWLSRYFGDVKTVTDIDFEYAGPKDRNYFEERGIRGQNRTSADIAISWESRERRRNMLLLDVKFTETSFGECGQQGNPEPWRCLSSTRVMSSPRTQCYRAEMGHTYWNLALAADSPFVRDRLRTERHCPFRYDFFQLMRNQLLAHCVERDASSGYNRVEFGVMYHAEADRLLQMAHPFTGERNPLKAWPGMLNDPDSFHVFTMQDFLSAIEGNLPEELVAWRAYLKQRYGV